MISVFDEKAELESASRPLPQKALMQLRSTVSNLKSAVRNINLSLPFVLAGVLPLFVLMRHVAHLTYALSAILSTHVVDKKCDLMNIPCRAFALFVCLLKPHVHTTTSQLPHSLLIRDGPSGIRDQAHIPCRATAQGRSTTQEGRSDCSVGGWGSSSRMHCCAGRLYVLSHSIAEENKCNVSK